MAAQTEQLTEAEARFQKLIGKQVKRRAEAAREERLATRDIAALCVEARAAGVPMAKLAEYVQVLAKDDELEGELNLRSVTRQAIDQLVAAYEHRPRAPRRRRTRGDANGHVEGGAIRMDAFG